MDDWARDLVEYEERQQAETEQRKIAFEKEEKQRTNKEREEKQQQEVLRAEQAQRLTPEALKRQLEQKYGEEEARQAQLSEEEQREERKAFKGCMWDLLVNEPEDQTLRIRWRVYRKRDELLRQEKLAEQARQREEERQEYLRREAEEKAARQELQRQREARWAAQRREIEEKRRLIAEKWARLVRKTEGVSKFQFQIMSLQESIPEEIKEWRSRVTWQYREGKAIRIDPSLPTPEKDRDLQEVRLAICRKEAQKYCEEDEQEQWKQDNIARLKWSIRPGNLTHMALWDEWFAPHEKPQNERFTLISNEMKLRDKQRKRVQFLSMSDLDTEIEEIRAWLGKYCNYACDHFPEINDHECKRLHELCTEQYRRKKFWD
jgi:hypothetical protein